MFLAACQTTNITNTKTIDEQTSMSQKNTSMPIVGGVETVYLPPFDISFQARMDTGAETSSEELPPLRYAHDDGWP